jgi:DNA-binding IclR family transcriptional regulator
MKMTEHHGPQLKKYELGTVIEAFTLIEYLLDTKVNLGLTQLSTRICLSKNKTFRLLTTLENCGFVERDQYSKYSIGVAAFEAARKIMSKMAIHDRIRPYLEEVTALVNESTYYAHLGAKDVLLVESVDCNRPIMVASLVGRSISFPEGAAYSLPQKRTDVIGGIILIADGFEPGVTAVIAPINFPANIKQGALVVVAPTSRMPAARIRDEIVPALRTVIQRHVRAMPQASFPVSVCPQPERYVKQRAVNA